MKLPMPTPIVKLISIALVAISVALAAIAYTISQIEPWEVVHFHPLLHSKRVTPHLTDVECAKAVSLGHPVEGTPGLRFTVYQAVDADHFLIEETGIGGWHSLRLYRKQNHGFQTGQEVTLPWTPQS